MGVEAPEMRQADYEPPGIYPRRETPMTRGVSPAPHHLILAYELQARYAAEEGWVILDVDRSGAVAEEAAFHRRDAWGRKPIDIRIVAVRSGQAAA
jgi:hypothetical protein